MKYLREISWAVAVSSLAAHAAPARAQAPCDVIVYRDANFAGPSEEITGDQAYVGDAWNDTISSIRVISGVWNFYWNANFGGPVLRLGPGDHPFVGRRWNDQISSLRCGGGGPDDSYAVDGQQYDWYDDGWNGPGFYLLGYAFRHGQGYGGGDGWHGFHHHGGGGHPGGGGGHPSGGHAGGGHAGHPHALSAPHVTHSFRGGGGHPGGGHPGGGHPGGGHPGGGHPSGGHPGGGHPGGGHPGGGGHPKHK